jgi:CRISPR-associated protein (TIGR02710 family)
LILPENILLICSVGGSPEPLVGTLKHWAPQRVVFVTSPETRPLVAETIVPLAQSEGVSLPLGCYDCLMLPDSQDLSACLGKLHELNRELERWLGRDGDFKIVVDYTGGTKTMTAALAMYVRRWPCRLCYVGGRERTKGGVGVVVSGNEVVLHADNPWDSLGYQAAEDFVVLFDQHAYQPAAACLEAIIRRVSAPARKRELATLKSLADAYAAWDRFDHKQALNLLLSVERNANDLRPVLPPQTREDLLAQVGRHAEHLKALQDSSAAGFATVLDLLSNARRRAAEGRYDDAVARIYRAVEALAQDRLRRQHNVADTGKVPLAQVPPVLQERWTASAVDGLLKLALQDVYLLLRELDDELGRRFADLQWHDPQHSPLVARNQSILAHGFTPVAAKVYQALWDGSLVLAQVGENELPAFPKLGAKSKE